MSYFILSVSVILSSILVSCSRSGKPAEMVNVFNGTDLAGNTYPAATVPFGSVQLGPDTSPDRTSGYHYKDTVIFPEAPNIKHVLTKRNLSTPPPRVLVDLPNSVRTFRFFCFVRYSLILTMQS